MKVFLLLLVAAAIQAIDGKLRYKYEGQTVTAIPESGRDINVLRIEFDVEASLIGSGPDVLIQVDAASVKVHNFTGMRFPVPEGIMAIEEMTETSIRQESKQNLATQLAKPFVASVNENGTISNIRSSSGEAYWSMNLKKGALSLLQLNIQTDAGLYSLYEEDVTGNCSSLYLVQSREHYHGHDHVAPTFLNVTKSRDYSQCSHRPILRHSFFSGFSLSDEELASKNIISNAKFAYNISGTKAIGGRLLVESATSEGQHIFSIFKPLSGSLVVYTQQRIRLLSRDEATATAPSADLAPNAWSMAMPNVITAKADLKFNDDQVVSEVAEAVGRLIDPAESNYMRGIYLNRIVERMRGASTGAWDRIATAAIQAGPGHLKLLMDLAPSAGTLESLLKFQSSLPRLTPNITAQYFAISGLFGEPSLEMVSTMQSICGSADVNNLRERKACMLSLASMLYNRYFRSGFILKNATFSLQELGFLETLRLSMEGLYGEAISGNISSQLLALKCLGNLGSPIVIDRLAAIANNESLPIVVRVHAIRALRRIPAAYNGKIQSVVLPIFTDWHNDVEIRLAAYRAVMMTQPSQAVVDLISAALHSEHDEQVLTYVYSHLKVLAFNPLQSEVQLSDSARVALEGLTAVIPAGMQYSRYYRIIDTYDDDRNAGVNLDVSVVGSSRSLIPREICVWMHGIVFGVRSNMFHTCLRLQGIQKLLQRLMRIGGPVYPDFLAQLSLTETEFEEYHGLIDFSIEGSEIQFMEIPPAISEAISSMEAMQRHMGALLAALRSPILKTVVLDSTLQVPSLIGLPVQQNNTYVLHLNLSLGQIGLVPACRIDPSQPCTLSMQPQARYRLGSQHSLGVDAAGLIQSKVLLHGMVSRERSDDRNWTFTYLGNGQNLSLGFEALLPRTRVTTGHTEVQPFLITVDRSRSPIGEQFYVRELNSWHASAIPDLQYDWAMNNTAKLTGFLFGYNSSATSCMPCMLTPGRSQRPFCGRVMRDFYVIPQEGAPEKLQIWYRLFGPAPRTFSAASFRSAALNAIHGDQESVEEVLGDLSRLSRKIQRSANKLEEIEENLELVETDAKPEEWEHDEVLVRRRRAAKRSDDRKSSRSSDGESSSRQNPAGGSFAVLELIGYRNDVVSHKIEVVGTRAPTNVPLQYRRDVQLRLQVGDRRIATVCSAAKVQYPRKYISMLPGSELNAEPVWSYSSKLTYGREACDDDNEIEFSLSLSRSNEQKRVTRLFRDEMPDADRYYQVAQCRAELTKGYYYTWPCRHLFTQLNEAHRLEVSIKADDMRQMTVGNFDVRKWVTAFLQNLRATYWSNLRTSFVRDIKDTKEIRFVGERNFQLPLLLDFSVTTPESTNEFRNVEVPHGAASLYFPMHYAAAYQLSGYSLPGVCAVQQIRNTNVTYVATFDNVVYNLTHPKGCQDNTELHMLLAADCTSASKFAVSSYYQTRTRQMEIRIATAAFPVTIRPVVRTGVPEVFVDNLKVTEEEYTVTSGGTKLTVINRNAIVTVRLDIGIFVIWTPDGAVLVGVSPLYSGLTCGWCGDHNGQKVDEFTTAAGTITTDSSEFARSYVAGLQQCGVASGSAEQK